MTPKEFFDKVALMREAQKRYFKYRTSDELAKAKKLESEIDAEIQRVINLTKPQSPDYVQGELFDNT